MNKHQQTEYNPKQIEPKWQKYWEENKTFKAEAPKKGEKKFYCLDMFPYPSGAGLHVGHPLGYTATDIYSRFKRMNGFKVLHPMGFDSFGLPAEQHALKTGEHPSLVTRENCNKFKIQMKKIGLSYDWDREIATSESDYYHWTQWIFVKLYNSWFDRGIKKARPIEELPIPADIKAKGELAVQAYQAKYRLAYYAEAMVNWCPALGTVLANEEVIDGKSEIGGHEVIRKPMKQWIMRITEYADRLIEDLVELNWPESIKEQQRNWIGRSEGVNIKERIKDLNIEIEVYDSIPQTFLAQTFCVIAPEHALVKKMVEGTTYEKSVMNFVDEIQRKKMEKRFNVENDIEGIFTGRYLDNPFGTGDLPIWIASYVLVDYGTGIVNCSSHDERDFAFAKKYNIPLKVAMLPPDPVEAEKVKNFEYSYLANDGIIQEPAECRGMTWTEARTPVINYMESRGIARRRVNYRLKDWLFSRQRYWGEPIPIIHWEDGEVTSLSEDQLPLVLPPVADYKPSDGGESPLAKAKDWLIVKCEKTGKKGRRETNVMPQWAGSCWYYLRFADPGNSKLPWSKEIEKAWMPVDLYVGGAEHAVLHLLYARFWHKVLFDLGYVSTNEPFQRLFNQGMIVAFAYKNKRGSIVPADEVTEKDGEYIQNTTGEKLERITAKMSKSLRNVVDPLEIIDLYSADTLRLYLMFMGPLDAMRPWDSKAIQGTHRFLKRAWIMVNEMVKNGFADQDSDENKKLIHLTTKKVGDDITTLSFNTAIAALMEFSNKIDLKCKVTKELTDKFILLLSPLAPHLAEELWQLSGHAETLAYETWPSYDPALLQSSTATVVIQIAGKKRGVVEVDVVADEATVKQKVILAMKGTNYPLKDSDKFIVVYNPGTKIPRLVNVVST